MLSSGPSSPRSMSLSGRTKLALRFTNTTITFLPSNCRHFSMSPFGGSPRFGLFRFSGRAAATARNCLCHFWRGRVGGTGTETFGCFGADLFSAAACGDCSLCWLPGHPMATCRLLGANRRPATKLTGYHVDAASFERGSGPGADAIEKKLAPHRHQAARAGRPDDGTGNTDR